MRHAKGWQTLLLLICILVAGCSRDPSTAEEKKARGEELLKKMSTALAAAKAMSLATDQTLDRLKGDDTRVQIKRSSQVSMRRPDKIHMKRVDDEGESEVWYNGKYITLASHKEKAWARGKVPDTIDETLDFIHTEYAIPIPVADFLYSSPYDAFMEGEATGGWVGREQIGTQRCNHLAFQNPAVDWELWLADDERGLPCRLKITHKQDPGAPVHDIVFKDWNLAPESTTQRSRRRSTKRPTNAFIWRARRRRHPNPRPWRPARRRPGNPRQSRRESHDPALQEHVHDSISQPR